jgi:hypothetical protein
LFELRTQQLNFMDAKAAREKRSDERALVQDFKDRRLNCSAACLVMRSRLLLHDSRLYAVTEEFGRGEKTRWAGADNQNLRIGALEV